MFIFLLLILLAGIVSFIGTKLFMKYCHENGFVARDVHKPWRQDIVVSGGLPVLLGIIISILFFSGIIDMILMASLLSLVIITYVGLLDDFSKKKGGLNKWTKPLLSFLATFPIMAAGYVSTTISLPIFGQMDLGKLYLVFLPVVIVGCSNMVNLLAGYNGLEAGLGMLYSAFLGVYALFIQNISMAVLSFAVFGGLLGFYYFNKFPSLIFPGDSLTYLLGGYLGIVATIGNMEKQALLVSIPFFIEAGLKIRSKFQAQSFCQVKNNIMVHEGPIYSLPHILGRYARFTEKQVVWILYGFQLICCCLIWVL